MRRKTPSARGRRQRGIKSSAATRRMLDEGYEYDIETGATTNPLADAFESLEEGWDLVRASMRKNKDIGGEPSNLREVCSRCETPIVMGSQLKEHKLCVMCELRGGTLQTREQWKKADESYLSQKEFEDRDNRLSREYSWQEEYDEKVRRRGRKR